MTARSTVKQIEVQIMSQTYVLACPADGEQALREAVAQVDAAMCRIRDAGKVKARDRIAVLAALNIAFDATRRDPALIFRHSSFGTPEHEPPHDSFSLPPHTEQQVRTLIERLDRALAHEPPQP